MFSLLRPNEEKIRRALEASGARSFNYRAVGATASTIPEGYKIDRHRQRLGVGARDFERARRAVDLFKMNDFGWVEVHRAPGNLEPGLVFATLARVMGIWTLNPCRIIEVFDDPGEELARYGFSFGTLEGHAEEGEERFQVEHHRGDDSVWYDILAFSRPHHLLARLGAPLSRSVQRRFFRDSKESMRRFVEAADDGSADTA